MSNQRPDWREATLRDVCDKPQYGWTTKADHKPTGPRLLRTSDITGSGVVDWTTVPGCRDAPTRVDQFRVLAGDLFVSRAGSVGASTLIDAPPPESVFASYLIRLRPRADVAPRFLKWFLQSPEYWKQISAVSLGTAVANVNASRLASLTIPIPPIAEQQQIVAAIEEQFSRLDAGVASLKRARRNLARMRAAVLQAAVEGCLLDRASDDEPVDSVLAGIVRARGGEVRPPSDGRWPLPQSWRWATVGTLFNVGIGTTPSRSNPGYWQGDVPWVSSGEVAFNRIGSTREHISTVALGNAATRLHPPGTVLLAMIGEGKTRGQAAILDIAAAHNQNCASIRVTDTPISPEWVYWCLVQRYEETRRQSSGNNQPALNKSRVEAIDLPLPPLQEQARLLEEIQRQMSITDAIDRGLTAALARSASLRQAVLREAFAGRLAPQALRDVPVAVSPDRLHDVAAPAQLRLDEVPTR